MTNRNESKTTHPSKLLAKDIVSYTLSANAAHIPTADIEKTIFGYLHQMEVAIRGAIKLEQMPRLHHLQVRDYMDRMDGG